MVFLSFQTAVSAQEEEDTIVFKPTIGLGVGMMTFYGDVSKGQKANNPLVSKVGFDLRITQKLTHFLDGSFYVLLGKVGANEQSATRSVNFESTISLGGVNVSYNFDHFLNRPRVLEPYFSLGFESFEFLTKADNVDQYGNTYNYWSDGTIRSLAETDPNKSKAIRLQRDYVYETDMRSQNLDGLGKYPERSYAIPIGAGVNINATDKISFRLGTTFHYTLTDHIDGVTKDSKGNREGKSGNDHFLFTSFNLNYSIGFGKKGDPFDFENMNDDDRLLAEADTDGDGVMDFRDLCASTSDGAEVDANGCPLDEDRDLVGDYRDKEPGSLDSLMVDLNGVTLSDSILELNFRMFLDSTGEFAFITDTLKREHTSDKSLGGTTGKKFMVKIGELNGGIDPQLAEELLSIPDVKTWEENGVTYITAGNFDNLPDALKRKLELAQKGFDKSEVVSSKKGGKLEKVDDKSKASSKQDNTINLSELSDPVGKIIYRVQVGAFSKKVRQKVFDGVPEIIAVPFSDGITRYFSGSFEDYKLAAKRKVDMVVDGYEGAFVVAFKDGKRIALGKTGSATPVEGVTTQADLEKIQEDPKGSGISKKFIKYKVQIGVYREGVPPDLLKIFITLKDIEETKTDEGLTRYTSGSFDTYDQATEHKNKLTGKGLKGAFVIGNFKGRLVTAQEAIELSK